MNWKTSPSMQQTNLLQVVTSQFPDPMKLAVTLKQLTWGF